MAEAGPAPPRLTSLVSYAGPALLVMLAVVWWKGWHDWRDGLGLSRESGFSRVADAGPTLLLGIAVTLLAIRGAHALLERHFQGNIPKLVRQIVTALAWTITAGIVGVSVFEVPVGSLVTTSGLLVAVVGIALKNMISDLFTGLSLPVKMGDWIEVDNNFGRVIEVSWRATRLVTRDDVTVIIPNTHLMSKPFRNYSQPEPGYRESFRVTLPTSVTAHQAERNLVAAARQVDAIAAMPTPPDARIAAFTDRGVEWELRYYVPDGVRAPALRYRVQRNLMRNLHYSGIKLATTVVEFHPAPEDAGLPTMNDELVFLASFDLFATLSSEDLRIISERMTRRLLRNGDPVVRQGDAGDSLFVLKEGLLSVVITSDGVETVVGQITPGAVFGEMSLLTGAPRSATVVPLVDSMVYEITRETLQPLMNSRPGMAEQMSEVLADRQSINLSKMSVRENPEDARRSLATQLLGRITAFFRLKPEDVPS